MERRDGPSGEAFQSLVCLRNRSINGCVAAAHCTKRWRHGKGWIPQGRGNHGQELDFTLKCHWKVVSGVVVGYDLNFLPVPSGCWRSAGCSIRGKLGDQSGCS